MRKTIQASVIIGLGLSFLVPALAGTVTTNIPIIITPGIKIVTNPPNPTVDCSATAGTLVAVLSTTGGNGNTVTFSGSSNDFVVQGVNIVVGPNGITAATCAAPMPIQFTVRATQ